MALDQQYITDGEFKDVYDHAGRTRAAIRGFHQIFDSLRTRSTKEKNNLMKLTLFS